MIKEKQTPFSEAVMKASGKIEFQFTNDAMFKLVLQDNKTVLRGLISSMLHIHEDEIYEINVENPIDLGESVNDKTFVLDIKVLLNNNMIINLEMQLMDYHNWKNRSLSYLCRNFDNLQRGEDYISAKPVVHIGFLDFDLFEDDEEFYSKFRMLNIKNYREYNSNFRLNVLYLNRTDNATEEDKIWKIDEWARLFKATTWEEIRMIAEKNETMVSAVEKMYEKQADEWTLEIIRRRQEEINHQRRMKREREEMETKLAELKNKTAELQGVKAELENANAELENANTELENANAELENANTELENANAELETRAKESEAKRRTSEEENKKLRVEIERLKAQLNNFIE